MSKKIEIIKLNKFEKARILAARGLELAEGALPKVKLVKGKVYLEKDYVKVAEEELNAGVLDLEIYRSK